MGWYIVCWMRAFNYAGKSGRMEYWYFIGISLVIISFLSLLAAVFNWDNRFIGAVIAINLLPYFSVLTRRIRDAGFNPWHVAWRFVPVIGQAVVLYITTRPSANASEPMAHFGTIEVEPFR